MIRKRLESNYEKIQYDVKFLKVTILGYQSKNKDNVCQNVRTLFLILSDMDSVSVKEQTRLKNF